MIQDMHRVIQLIEDKWKAARIVVVGDLMLDRYIWGEVDRISSEAPVPVVRSMHTSSRSGGATNVAINIARFGADAHPDHFYGDGDPDKIPTERMKTASLRSRKTERKQSAATAKSLIYWWTR